MAEGGREADSEDRHMGDGRISNTVEVHGLSSNMSQEVLEMYFKNSQQSGGGDIEEVQIRDRVGYVTFKKAEVARRVVSHGHQQVAGRTWTVTLFCPSPPKPCYENRVLVQGLDSAVTEELLRNFLETVTEAKVREFLYGKEEGKVVVTLSDNIDIGKLRKTFQERSIEGAFLEVARVAISSCILVQNLQPSVSDDTILLYFENKRSGGGDVERVEMNVKEGHCLVYFQDHTVIDRVLSRTHKIDGADVEVHLHHECLGSRSSKNKSDPNLRMSGPGNKDGASLKENADKQSNDEATSSASSNPDKERDFVEVQKWQENDGKNCTLPLWIKYKRAPEMMIIKDMKKIPCSWNFHVYWNFYTKTKPGQQMFHEIVNKYNCSVTVCTDDEDLFIFEVTEKSFEHKSDVVHYVHVVLENVYKCAQQFLYIKTQLVDQRIQGDVIQRVRQRKELESARIEFMGQQDLDAICVICTQKDKMSVIHVITEIIHNVRESYENDEEIISVDHKWQKVMKHFGYLQKLCDKYPKVTIICDKTKAAIMLKGPRDQSKAVTNDVMASVGTAHSEVKEDIFSPGCQFEIFTYPEMCYYIDNIIDNIITEHSIVWIPDHMTKKIHLFSKKIEKVKGIDKLIRGCVQERLYPLQRDQPVHSALDELKKKHVGKIVIDPSPTGLLVTTADDIFQSVDAAVQEILSKRTELKISRGHEEKEAGRTRTTVVERVQSPKTSNKKKNSADAKCLENTEVKLIPEAIDTRRVFTTAEGIKVFVYKCSILRAQVDVIVNAANEGLKHTGGVSRVIAKAAGREFNEESKRYIKDNGSLDVGTSCITSGGNLNYTFVIHTVGPQWDKYKTSERVPKCMNDLWKAVLGCFFQAETLQVKSIALPAVSSGMHGVPMEICASLYFTATLAYSISKQDTSGLKEIHFIDVNDEILELIQLVFTAELEDNREAAKQFYDRLERVQSRFGQPSILQILKSDASLETTGHLHHVLEMDKGRFQFTKTFKVLIYTGDITNSKCKAMVSCVNRDLKPQEGVGMAIWKKAGLKFETSLMKHRGKHYEVGDVLEIDGGNMECKVICCIIPKWTSSMSDEDYERQLGQCFRSILEKSKAHESIAVPLIGKGFKGNSTDICGRVLLEYLLQFSRVHREKEAIREVHIVSLDDGPIACVKNIFNEHFNSEKKMLDAECKTSGYNIEG